MNHLNKYDLKQHKRKKNNQKRGQNKDPGKENEGGNSQPNPREGKWAIVRDNTTRKLFFADKTPYIPTAEVGLDEQENSDKEEM